MKNYRTLLSDLIFQVTLPNSFQKEELILYYEQKRKAKGTFKRKKARTRS